MSAEQPSPSRRETLAQQVKQQQLLLDMYFDELRRGPEAVRAAKLLQSAGKTNGLLWQYRAELARLRLPAPEPGQRPPPTVIVNPPFSLPMTPQGREEELLVLDDWLQAEQDTPLLALAGAAGMGKAALLWHWLEQRQAAAQGPALIVWWEFGNGDQGLPQLIGHLLHAFGDDASRFPNLRQAIGRLLERLKRKPALFLFTGVEHLLHLPPPANGQERLAGWEGKWRDPYARQFFAALAQPGLTLARTVIAGPVWPLELAGNPGVLPLTLPGLRLEQGLRLLQDAGIQAGQEQLASLVQAVGGHPLTLALLAGMLSPDAAALPALLGQLARRSQADCWTIILDRAYQALPPGARRLLGYLATFGRPVAQHTIAALLGVAGSTGASGQPGGSARSELAPLQKRGFVSLSTRQGVSYYDLHPVVRRFVYAQKAAPPGAGRPLSFSYTRDGGRDDVEPSPEQLQPAIELYRFLVEAGRNDEALALYRSRLSRPLFFLLGAHQLEMELLSALFPKGMGELPALREEGDQAWVLNSLADSCYYAGRLQQATQLFGQSQAIYQRQGNRRAVAVVLSDLAVAQMELGALKQADDSLRQSIQLCRQTEDRYQEGVGHRRRGQLLANMGDWSSAAAELDTALSLALQENRRQLEASIWLQGAEAALLRGRADIALAALEKVRANPDGQELAGSALQRQKIKRQALAGWAELLNGSLDQAQADLGEALRQSEARQLHAFVPQIWLNCARLARAQVLAGQKGSTVEKPPLESSPTLQVAWTLAGRALRLAQGSGMVLVLADAHNLLGQLALDGDKRPLARQHAGQAAQFAACDGPPYQYAPALIEAEEIERRASRSGGRLPLLAI